MGFSVTAGLIVALAISAMSGSRTCRVAALVGLVWSEILGFGFVAPAIVATHRLRPETLYQWLLIDSVILAALLLGASSSWRFRWRRLQHGGSQEIRMGQAAVPGLLALF